MNPFQLVGLILTIGLILGLSVFSGMSRKTVGQKNGAAVVAGIIMGTLVGGSSTVGTAQLAYNYGMSAWWFTLGGGISCLVLALGFAGPLRHNGGHTLVGMINKEFGGTAGVLASVLSAVGTFIITTLFMIAYVVIGGTKGAGMVGILKLALLYIAMIGSGILALHLSGGTGAFAELVSTIDNPEGVQFWNVFARGIGKDLGAGVSLLLGVLTTQTYAQAVLSAKSDGAARTGALISTFLIPPIGIGGILVGLFMRATHPGIVAKTALTSFVTQYMPPVLSGIVLGTLFVAVVGTGAGLALGISFILNEDIVNRLTHKFDGPEKQRMLGRTWMVVILALACVLSCGPLGDMILGFAFMSMGLRAAVVFAPLVAALFFPGRVSHKFAVAAIIAGPVAVLAGNMFGLPFDPLFIGIAVSSVLVIAGAVFHRAK